MKIELQYRGQKLNIYAIIDNDGKCPVIEFLEQLKQNDIASHKSLIRLMTRHADHGPLINKRKSRALGGNLLEFKSRQGDRILYFYMPGGKTILTHGFHKGAPIKTELRKAERTRDQYLRENENV